MPVPHNLAWILVLEPTRIRVNRCFRFLRLAGRERFADPADPLIRPHFDDDEILTPTRAITDLLSRIDQKYFQIGDFHELLVMFIGVRNRAFESRFETIPQLITIKDHYNIHYVNNLPLRSSVIAYFHVTKPLFVAFLNPTTQYVMNFLSVLSLSLLLSLTTTLSPAKGISWSDLPDLPDPEGYAGMFAGTINGSLIAAGGHHFADGVPWWDGGYKVWSNVIYTLDQPNGSWTTHKEKIPRPLGDGVGVSFRNNLICAGGGDANEAYAHVFMLHQSGNEIKTSALPSLPTPRMRMGGALLGHTLYLVGGRDHPKSPHSLNSMIALDLSKPPSEQTWGSLPPIPGPTRMMPVVATTNDALYVFSGIQIIEDENGMPKNIAPYLSDAYRYTPSTDGMTGYWTKLADLPNPVAGAPSPAWLQDSDTIVIFGGVDGTIEAITDRSSVSELPDQILVYHISENRWSHEEAPDPPLLPRVNAPTVLWHDGYTIVNGEYLPAKRTNTVTVIKD